MELKPCPFCGANPKIYERNDGYRTGWDVVCSTKGCYLEFGGDYWFDTETLAVALWNNRHTDTDRAVLVAKVLGPFEELVRLRSW